MRPITSLGLSTIVVAASLLLTACGGGSSSSGTGGAIDTTGSGSNTSGSNSSGSSSGSGFTDSFGNSVSSSDGFSSGDYGANGSAGDGLPIVGGTVVIIDSLGNQTAPVTTNASGYYRVKVNGLVPPLIAKVTKLDGSVRYSVSTKSLVQNGFVVVNITGLTSQVAYDVAGSAGLSTPASLPNNFPSTTVNQIAASVDRIKTALAEVIVAAGLNAATFDPINVAFVPNSKGYDFVLDNSVTPAVPGLNATVKASTFVPTTATKAANLATAQTEVQTFFDNFSALFATASPSAASVLPFLNSGLLMDGKNQANQASSMAAGLPVGIRLGFAGIAPFAGAPVAGPSPATPSPTTSVTYDGNGCVTSLWVYLTTNGVMRADVEMRNVIPAGNPAGVCTGGNWTLAGNQRQYHSGLIAQVLRLDRGTLFYRSGLFINTDSNQGTGGTQAATPYDRVEVTGPGIATWGNTGATSGTVSLVPTNPTLSEQNTINDPYYGSTSSNVYYTGLEGSALLEDCASPSFGLSAWLARQTTTPCLNLAAVSAGVDYTVNFYSGSTLLETHVDRLPVKPMLAADLPAQFYATINSITTNPSPLTSGGGTVSMSWTMPAGVLPLLAKFNINDAANNGATLVNKSLNTGAAATSTNLTIGSLPAAPAGPGNHFGMVVYSLGGLIVASAKGF